MARNGKKKTQKQKSLPFIEPDAAGIDIGATEIYVAVSEERDNRPVRKFRTFTEELHALRSFLFVANEGKIRRRYDEEQLNQVSCLNLVTNAVVLWNTVYLSASRSAQNGRPQRR